MKYSRTALLWAVAGALLLAACSNGGNQRNQPSQTFQTTPEVATPDFGQTVAPTAGYPAPGYPAPGTTAAPATAAASAYPAPSARSGDGRSQTAFQSYKVALDWAKQNFGADVQLYEVIPSRVMIANLGNPPIALGWFYKFRAPSHGADDLFVQVVDGEFGGSRILTPLGDLPKAEKPIDIGALSVDSDKVSELFKQRAPALGITLDPKLTYDLQLIYLEGSSAPVWSVVNPDGNTWLFSVDASTGTETKDPNA
jgi:hypothetical protein